VAYPSAWPPASRCAKTRTWTVFDWHYVFGWDNPHSSVVAGPLFFELPALGTGLAPPRTHQPRIKRDAKELIQAEVVYRFYDGLPCSTVLATRNARGPQGVLHPQQPVRLPGPRVHACSDCAGADGPAPTDEIEPAVIRLMAKDNLKPFARIPAQPEQRPALQIGIRGVLQLRNFDAFTEFQLLERNTNVYSGTPTYRNHTTILTELHDWAVYLGRAFSYTNRRFHPENATFLPKGERYDEENICLIHRHASLPNTLEYLKRQDAELRQPVTVQKWKRGMRSRGFWRRG